MDKLLHEKRQLIHKVFPGGNGGDAPACSAVLVEDVCTTDYVEGKRNKKFTEFKVYIL
jgi:hypothetical protein